MYLAAVIRGQPLEQFCERAFRAVAAVDKRRNDREPQVRVSSGAQAGLRKRWPQTAPKARWCEAGVANRTAPKDTRSNENPRKTAFRQSLKKIATESVPENREAERNQRRTFQLFDRLPCGARSHAKNRICAVVSWTSFVTPYLSTIRMN